jgi:hypothetical protein
MFDYLFARAIEKLVREATLEEAANVCENVDDSRDEFRGAVFCAEAIRALKREGV